MKHWILAALLAVNAQAQAWTADELVAKHLEARGGQAALHAVNSVRMTGRYDPASGQDMRIANLNTRSGKLRSEFSLQGMTAVTAYDGKSAWQIQPFGGRKDPFRMSEEDAQEQADSADLDGPLVDYQAKGHRLEYLGTEDVDGTGAHKLKLTRKNGSVVIYFLDPDYFLTIREHRQRMVRGVLQESETELGEYEKVAGLMLPFSYAFGAPGSAQKTPLVVEQWEFNVPADDGVFRFPLAAPATQKK